MNITLIGDGGWGTAIGLLLNSYGHSVTLWGPFPEVLDEIRASRENSRFLPGVALPDTLRWTADPAEAASGAEAVVLASPSKFFAEVCGKFTGLIPSGTLVVSLTKGLCEATHCRMSELAQDLLGLDAILGSMKMVAEGVWNAKVIHTLGRTCDIALPITDVVYALCYEGLSALTAVGSLMTRDMKPER